MTLYHDPEIYIGRFYLAPHDRYTQVVVGDGNPIVCGSVDPYIAPQILKVHAPPFRQKIMIQKWHEGEQLSVGANLVFVSNKHDEIYLTAWDESTAFEEWDDAYRYKLALEGELQSEWLRQNPTKAEAYYRRQAQRRQEAALKLDRERREMLEAARNIGMSPPITSTKLKYDPSLVPAVIPTPGPPTKGFTPFNSRLTKNS